MFVIQVEAVFGYELKMTHTHNDNRVFTYVMAIVMENICTFLTLPHIPHSTILKGVT